MNIIWVRGTGLGEAFDKGVIIWTQTELYPATKEVSTLVTELKLPLFSPHPLSFLAQASGDLHRKEIAQLCVFFKFTEVHVLG